MAGSVDGTIRRFDVRAGCLFTDDIGQSVTGIAVSGDNLCVLGACLDGHMRLLDKATGALLAQYTGTAPILSCIASVTSAVDLQSVICLASDAVCECD